MIIVHGRADIIEKSNPDFEAINKIWVAHYGSGVLDWSKGGIYIRIDPDKMFTHARYPRKFPAR